MHLLVGLGNPGTEYALTRHNAGFMLADSIARAYAFPGWTAKHKGHVTKGNAGGLPLVLLKPQTYMNLSGQSVQAAASFYKIPPENILVAHDELDLPLAQLKYKTGGGDAGHNGLKSITQMLGTPNYARLRIGIGRPAHKSQVSDYVLHTFPPAEELEIIQRLAWLTENIGGLLTNPHATLAKLKATA